MSIKKAKTKYPILDLIKERWSPRSFNKQSISKEEIYTIIEAGSWAFSANNEQPWRFFEALKGTEDFSKILETLMPGNTPWAQHAQAFIVSIAKKTFEKEGNPQNGNAEHDLGAANATMALQARSMNIYCHPMAGFDKAMLSKMFHLNEDLKPMTVMALGYLGDPNQLDEPYLGREITERSRKSLSELVLNHRD